MKLTREEQRQVAAMRRVAKKAMDKLELARIYLDDGAPFEAARNYREGADLLEKWGRMRKAALGVPS